jgi:cell shape-determining protein MreC
MKRKDGNDKLSRVKRNITTSIDLFDNIEHFESDNKSIKELCELHETLMYFAMRVTKVLDRLIEEQGRNNGKKDTAGGNYHG